MSRTSSFGWRWVQHAVCGIVKGAFGGYAVEQFGSGAVSHSFNSPDAMALARGYIDQLRGSLAELPVSSLSTVFEILERAYRARRTIFVCGNGGSAATASHLAVDLAKNTRFPGAPTAKVISLVDNVPALTAWANDEGYETVFSGQLDGLIDPGDVLIGISTSGNSENVLRALRFAREAGAATVGLLGFAGGAARELCDAHVAVPGGSVERAEDIHMALAHILTGFMRSLVSSHSRIAASIR